MRNTAAPANLHELRSALGLFGYYRRFIPHFSTIAKPLVTLTEKDKPFQWKEEEETVDLKDLLSSAPVLAHPRTTGLFILDTDASEVDIGALLSQQQEDEEKVIAFGSRTLTKAETTASHDESFWQ